MIIFKESKLVTLSGPLTMSEMSLLTSQMVSQKTRKTKTRENSKHSYKFMQQIYVFSSYDCTDLSRGPLEGA